MPSSYQKPIQLPLFAFEKACSRCGAVKPLNEFPLRPEGKDGHRGQCNGCARVRWLRYYYRNQADAKAEMRARYWGNHARERERRKAYYDSHADERRCASKEWKASHPQRAKETAQRWEKLNRAKRREQNRARYWRDLDRSRALGRAQRSRHPELFRYHARLRKLRKMGIEGRHTGGDWRAVCAFYGDCCLRCGTAGRLTRDHVIPITKGGTDDIGNIQPLCFSCNSSKKTRLWDYRPHNI